MLKDIFLRRSHVIYPPRYTMYPPSFQVTLDLGIIMDIQFLIFFLFALFVYFFLRHMVKKNPPPPHLSGRSRCEREMAGGGVFKWEKYVYTCNCYIFNLSLLGGRAPPIHNGSKWYNYCIIFIILIKFICYYIFVLIYATFNILH